MTATQALHHDLAYETAKAMAVDPDAQVRMLLAARSDVRPELLFFLANDGSAEVRREIAANAATPAQADALLSRDGDPDVRTSLANKIGRVLPGQSPEQHRRAEAMVARTLATLARDEIAEVRVALAEALKNIANAPTDVVKTLARDTELAVCEPVLRYSPVLDDAELVALVEHHRGSLAVAAIAKRDGLGGDVSDAIAAADDETAVAALLANDSAQIREQTLDRIVEAAAPRPSWHAPLVERPALPARVVQRMVGFVAGTLLQRLEARSDLDPQTRSIVASTVRQRLAQKTQAELPQPPAPPAQISDDQAMRDVRALRGAGALNEPAVQEAVMSGDRQFARAALVVLSGLSEDLVDRIMTSRSARGLVSLTWKAGLSPRLALQIQLRLGAIAPSKTLAPRDGDWPMRQDEMEWQLSFFGA